MGLWILAVGLLVAQTEATVPAPPSQAADLLDRWRAILEAERDALSELGSRSSSAEEKAATEAFVSHLERDLGDVLWFRPLPEAQMAGGQAFQSVPIRGPGLPTSAAITAVRARSADDLFALAQDAAAPDVEQYGLAQQCLRGVIERDPDHREARRLLGFVAHEGGWATPQAADNLSQGTVLDPTYGWVQTDWVEHLAQGQLPGVAQPGRPLPWLPASEADRLRAEFFERRWQIYTAHFDIETDVPLSEAIQLGRHLEAFHDAFFMVMADAFDPDRLDIPGRFRDPQRWATTQTARHKVWYFADRDDYIDYASRKLGRDETGTLGFFLDPALARRSRTEPRSYFFRDPDQPIDALATLFHEVSHQLLFENGGPTLYDRNQGQYWVWEGLGTYFETFRPQDDGSYELGRLAGPRIDSARAALRLRGRLIPLDDFIAMGSNSFMSAQRAPTHYAQAMALTIALLHHHQGQHRHAFLNYVRDAYHGRFRPGMATSRLAERLENPLSELQGDLEAALSATPTGP